MKRPLSILVAAALIAGSTAAGVAPASAIEFGISTRSGEWHNDRWDDNWRWNNHRHHRHRDVGPHFSFSLGLPFPGPRAYYRPYRDDCYRGWDGALYCRAY